MQTRLWLISDVLSRNCCWVAYRLAWLLAACTIPIAHHLAAWLTKLRRTTDLDRRSSCSTRPRQDSDLKDLESDAPLNPGTEADWMSRRQERIHLAYMLCSCAPPWPTLSTPASPPSPFLASHTRRRLPSSMRSSKRKEQKALEDEEWKKLEKRLAATPEVSQEPEMQQVRPLSLPSPRFARSPKWAGMAPYITSPTAPALTPPQLDSDDFPGSPASCYPAPPSASILWSPQMATTAPQPFQLALTPQLESHFSATSSPALTLQPAFDPSPFRTLSTCSRQSSVDPFGFEIDPGSPPFPFTDPFKITRDEILKSPLSPPTPFRQPVHRRKALLAQVKKDESRRASLAEEALRERDRAGSTQEIRKIGREWYEDAGVTRDSWTRNSVV